MSQAEDLLNSLSPDDISMYASDSVVEEHIVIDDYRVVSVPDSLKRIAVQHDHNIETVTFDCPRYWDGNDLSQMYIYINYQKPDKVKGRYLTKNIRVDEADENLIHFDWTIGNEFTDIEGKIIFLVCAVKTDSEGMEEIHWNTEICKDMVISEGLECTEDVIDEYPDIITDLLSRMDTLIAADTPILDTSLSKPGFAADAEAAGVILRRIEDRISTIIEGTEYSQVEGNPIFIKDCGRNSCNVTVKGDTEQEIVEGSEPSPENPVEVLAVTGENKVVINNKNLFKCDVSNYSMSNTTFNTNEDGSISIVGTPTKNYEQIVTNMKILIAKGSEITINWGKSKEMLRDSTSNPFMWLYDKNGGLVSALAKNVNSVVLSDDVHSITFGFENMIIDKSINEVVYCQMELDSLSTEYVVPESVEFPISLGDMKLFSIAGYEDYIYKNEEDSKWYKKKYINDTVLEVDAISNSGAFSDNLACFYSFNSDRKVFKDRQNIYILSNKFMPMTLNDYLSSDYGEIEAISDNSDNSAIFFRIKKETIGGDTVELCRTYLTENPIDLYYILAEPVDEEITDENLIAQLEKLAEAKTYSGENYIALVCDNKVKGNLSLEYRQFAVCSYGDLEEFQTEIDEVQNGLEELETKVEEDVNTAINDVNTRIDNVTASIPTKVSQLTNDSGYATTSALTNTNNTVATKTIYNDITIETHWVSWAGGQIYSGSVRDYTSNNTITKSGYYPIGAVHVTCGDAGRTYHLTGQSGKGNGTITVSFRYRSTGNESIAQSDMPGATVFVAWVKIR